MSEEPSVYVIVRTLDGEECLQGQAGAHLNAKAAERTARELAADPSLAAAYRFEVREIALNGATPRARAPVLFVNLLSRLRAIRCHFAGHAPVLGPEHGPDSGECFAACKRCGHLACILAAVHPRFRVWIHEETQ